MKFKRSFSLQPLRSFTGFPPFRLCRTVLVLAAASVCAFGQTNTISTFAGSQSLGAGFAGDGGVPTAAQLNAPSGVAVDSAGNVYIADFNNYVVRMVSATTGKITTFAGTPGTSGSTGDNGLATNARLAGPLGLTIDSSGNLYIADGPNNRIRKVAPSGIITTVAGGTAGAGGDGGAATSASLNYPAAVAVDSSGNLYIADLGNDRIRKVSGGIITTVAGSGLPGYNADNISATTAQLYLPKGVAVDSSGNLYIADTGNNRIREVSSGIITTIAGNGTSGYSGDKGAATAAQLNAPAGVAVDPTGIVYIADTANNVIRKILGTSILTVAGTGTAGYGGDGGLATSALLNGPTAVGIDSTGALTYVADTQNNVIRLFTNTIVSGVLPHFAAGGTYVTGFYLINKSSSQSTGFTLSFYDSTGAPVAVPVNGGSASTSITGTVAPLGTAYYEIGIITANPGISGSVVIQSNSSLVSQAIIRHLSAANVYYEASVPSTTGAFEIETAFDATTFAPTSAQIYTGLGIANLDAINTGTVTCTARDSTGTIIPNAIPVLTLPPQGHGAGYNFPALFGYQGTLDCVSTTRMGVIALRFLGNDAFSALPVFTIR